MTTEATRTRAAFLSLIASLLALPVCALPCLAQTPGMAALPAQPPALDAQHRPITAGGFVTAGSPLFVNVANASGLAQWRNHTGTPDKQIILEAKGSGVCLLDYDRDGWLDIYLVNGSTFPALAGREPSPRAALFRNNHDGTFTDVTLQAGVANLRWGLGCAVGDFDNDGWPDLYVSNLGENRLYRNNGNGTFTDVAPRAGVALTAESGPVSVDHTGVTFGDYDGDGRLDLFVAGYIEYDFQHPPLAGTSGTRSALCQYRGANVMCGPRGLTGARDHLFHNNGDGTFTDVSLATGTADAARFYGLGALFADVNNDGRPDLLVADDSTPNYLYLNRGHGLFQDASFESGFALNGEGREVSNMGIAAGDYDHTGHLSLVTTVFSDDTNVFFRNDGAANFTDIGDTNGTAAPTMPFVGFGDGFLDFDNDGWLDLLIVNGHVYPGVDAHPDWGMSYAQRPLLFRNQGNGRFTLMPALAGSGLAELIVGRGAAFGDLFNDGKIDVVVNNLDGPPVLLRNVVETHHHWIEFSLVGGPGSPRDAVGATVYLRSASLRQRADVLSGGSYLSSNDPRVHFGLADSASVADVEIHWPSGRVEHLRPPAVDRIFTVVEGRGVVCEATAASQPPCSAFTDKPLAAKPLTAR